MCILVLLRLLHYYDDDYYYYFYNYDYYNYYLPYLLAVTGRRQRIVPYLPTDEGGGVRRRQLLRFAQVVVLSTRLTP